MPHPRMAAIEALGVDPVELPHPGGEIPLRGLQQQMVMVAHQTVGMAPPVIAYHSLFQDGEKRLPILLVEVDSLAGIAAGGDVVEGAGIGEAQRTSHGRRIPIKTDNSRPDPLY